MFPCSLEILIHIIIFSFQIQMFIFLQKLSRCGLCCLTIHFEISWRLTIRCFLLKCIIFKNSFHELIWGFIIKLLRYHSCVFLTIQKWTCIPSRKEFTRVILHIISHITIRIKHQKLRFILTLLIHINIINIDIIFSKLDLLKLV